MDRQTNKHVTFTIHFVTKKLEKFLKPGICEKGREK